MSSNNNSGTSGGIGFGGLLTILFIGLKLTGYITWPWLWVLCPIWIPAGLALLFVAFAFGMAVITGQMKL